jgi:hypothetical protein
MVLTCGTRLLHPVETMNSSTPSASLSPREAAYCSAAAGWVIGSDRLRTLPVPAKSSRKAATATLAAWTERHQHAIAVSRRNTTVGSATIRQIKFLSYRTDSGAPF